MRQLLLPGLLAILLAPVLIAGPAVAGGTLPPETGKQVAGLRNAGEISLETNTAKQSWDIAYQRGLRLWEVDGAAGDADEVLALLRHAADLGHAQSQNLLGRFYDKGRVVERDLARALYWYERAAGQGLVRAQLNAGLMYRLGDGAPRDLAKAFAYIEEAAEGQSAEAQYVLALMLESGEASQADPETAVRWYRLAAEAGYAPAQHNLAVAYATGAGVARSERMAVSWYRRAALSGQPKSQFLLGKAFADGIGAPYDAAQAYVWFMLAGANAGRDAALRAQAHEWASRVARELTPEQLAKAKRDVATNLNARG